MDSVPVWMLGLDEEDSSFIRNFLLASGSLKEIAGVYGVSYPTVRLRLDRLIQKIRINTEESEDPYVSLIKRLALNEKIDFEVAKTLISAYRKNMEEH